MSEFKNRGFGFFVYSKKMKKLELENERLKKELKRQLRLEKMGKNNTLSLFKEADEEIKDLKEVIKILKGENNG